MVLTLFTFEIFKQCDQMAVAINSAGRYSDSLDGSVINSIGSV